MLRSTLHLILAAGLCAGGSYAALAVDDAHRSVLGQDDDDLDVSLDAPALPPAKKAVPVPVTLGLELPKVEASAPVPAQPPAAELAPAPAPAPVPTPPPAPAPTEAPKDAPPAYEMPREKWAKDAPQTNPKLNDLFKKYLAREENTVRNFITGPVMAMPTQDVKGNFSVNNPAKIKAKKAALKALRAAYPKEFWDWLDEHDDIKMGLYLTTRPTPPQYLMNLASLWRAVGKARADKYAHLLLAAALRPTPVWVAPAPPAFAPTPVEQKLAAMIRQGAAQVPEPLVYFVHHKDKFQKEGNFKDAEINGVNLDCLAALTNTYPHPGGISVQDNILKLISRLETRVPEADGIKWPLFHPENAPYYLLNPLTLGLPAAEQDFLWGLFQPRPKPGEGAYVANASAPVGPRILGYGKYGFEYESPEVKYKKSAWHPDSLPRLWEDGGVCGRMARIASADQNTLGVPACQAGQPIHCAFMVIGQGANGKFYANIGQSVTGGWTNTSPHHPVGLTPAIQGFEGTAVSWLAMCETANRISPANYYYSLFLAQVADEAPDLKTKIELLKTAVNVNPYHLGAWTKLVNVSSQMGTKSFNSVLFGMEERLAWPDGPPEMSVPTPADLKEGGKKALPAPVTARDKTGDGIARVVVAQTVPGNYDRMLAASVKSPLNLQAGTQDMWYLMQKLDDDGVLCGEGIDPVFQKYAAMVSPDEAGQIFKANFEKALLSGGNVYGAEGCVLTTVVNSFRDIGAHMNPPTRVETLTQICKKIEAVAPKFCVTSKATLLYGKTFGISCVAPNQPYASALGQLCEALKANGRPDIAQGTMAAYQAEAARLAAKARAADRKRLTQQVHDQIEKLREEDRRHL